MAMATKLGRIETYLEGLLTMKLYNALMMWSCKVTWQTNTIISLLPDCLRPPNLAGWQLTLTGSYPQSQMILSLRGLTRSRDKLKLFNLHYPSAYGHQT